MSKCTRCTYINYQITRHEQNNLRTYFHHQKQFSDHLFVHWSLLHPARQSKIPQMFASSFWWNWFLPHHMWRCGDGVQQQECGDQQWLVQLSHFWEVSDIEMLRVSAAGGSWWHLAGEVLQCHVKCQHWHWHRISQPKKWHLCKPLQHNMKQLNHFWWLMHLWMFMFNIRFDNNMDTSLIAL